MQTLLNLILPTPTPKAVMLKKGQLCLTIHYPQQIHKLGGEARENKNTSLLFLPMTDLFSLANILKIIMKWFVRL